MHDFQRPPAHAQEHPREAPEREERLAEAERHMDFMIEVYEHQRSQGWWFLHEHPHSASSWKLPGVEELSQKPGVQITEDRRRKRSRAKAGKEENKVHDKLPGDSRRAPEKV